MEDRLRALESKPSVDSCKAEILNACHTAINQNSMAELRNDISSLRGALLSLAASTGRCLSSPCALGLFVSCCFTSTVSGLALHVTVGVHHECSQRSRWQRRYQHLVEHAFEGRREPFKSVAGREHAGRCVRGRQCWGCRSCTRPRDRCFKATAGFAQRANFSQTEPVLGGGLTLGVINRSVRARAFQPNP